MVNRGKVTVGVVTAVSFVIGLAVSLAGCSETDITPIGKPVVLRAYAADTDRVLTSAKDPITFPGKKDPGIEAIRQASSEILKKISEGGFDESVQQVQVFLASPETRAVLVKYKEFLGESLTALVEKAGELSETELSAIDVSACITEIYDAMGKIQEQGTKVDLSELEALLNTGIDLVTDGVRGLNEIDVKKWVGDITSSNPEFQKILEDAQRDPGGIAEALAGEIAEGFKGTKDTLTSGIEKASGPEVAEGASENESDESDEVKVGRSFAEWGMDIIKKIMTVGIDTTVLPVVQSQVGIESAMSGIESSEVLKDKRVRLGLVEAEDVILKDTKAPKSVSMGTDPFVLECRMHDILNRDLNTKDLHPSAGASDPDGVWPREPSLSDKDGSWVYRYYNVYYNKSPLDTRPYGRIYSDVSGIGTPPLFRDIKESYRNALKLDLRVFQDGRIPTTARQLYVVDEVVLSKARADMQYVFSTIAGGEVVSRVKEMISQAKPLNVVVDFDDLEAVSGFRYNDIPSVDVFKCIYDLELSGIKEADIDECINQKNTACRQAIEGAVAQFDLSTVDIGKERLFYDWFLTYFYLKNYTIL